MNSRCSISSTLAIRDYYAGMPLPAVAPRADCHAERHGTFPMSGVQGDMQKLSWPPARQSARGATARESATNRARFNGQSRGKGGLERYARILLRTPSQGGIHPSPSSPDPEVMLGK